ncbi:MAG TPA: methyl-accepting chemotaxis protein [Coleofasciculaceae cyanobacterium]
MQNLNLKTRILIGYMPALVLFLILGGVVYSSVLNREKVQKEVLNSQDVIIKTDQLVLGVSRIVRNVRGQALFPKDNSYQDSYKKGLQEFQEISHQLKKLLLEPKQQERFNTLMAEANQNIKISNQVFDLIKAGQNAKAVELTAQLRMADVDKSHEEILQQEVAVLTEKTNQEAAARGFLLLVVVVGSVLSAIITITTGLLITSATVKSINQAASTITTSSSQIAVTIEQQERIASQQAASVNETTTTMDELEASCRQAAEQAKAAVTAAQQALGLAQGGTQAVEETLEGMFTLEKKVGAIAEQIVYLSEQAEQIGSISQLVADLANKTNMLAFNSSVEAVRAGEHGKGFAVVANEIRKLADQSEKATEKIGELVAEIQSAINSTVMVTDEGTKTVATGVQVARKTNQAFTGVSDAINKVVLNNQQISLNLKQQVDAMQQIVEAMETVNKGAKETASGIGQTKLGTEQLNEAALVLKRIV